MKNIFTSILIVTCFVCFSQAKQKKQITIDQIDAVFSKWNSQHKAGLAVGVLSDGKIIYTKGYGLANLEHKVPINPNTKFYIGDLAKEFTVYAILLLEERGKISLQDDIRKYLPSLKSLKRAISIKQLIHHTSGINKSEVSKELAGWNTTDVFSKEQAYAMVLNQSKSIPNSGEQWHSDVGFMILEDLIAQITKVSYSDFITQEIFTPLGMVHSVVDIKGKVITNKAQGYFTDNDSFLTTYMSHNQTIVSNVYTTVEDMCLWAKELFKPKIGTEQLIKKFDGLSVVNGEKIKENNTALYTGGHRFWNFHGVKKYYHIEVSGGYASKLIRYPDYDLALIVLGNDGEYNGDAATEASALYIEDFLEPMPDDNKESVFKKLSNKQLTSFEGNYWSENNYLSRKIHLINDTLRYFRGLGNESTLVPLTKNSFKMMTWGNVTVSFDTTTIPKKMAIKVGDDTFNFVTYKTNATWMKDLNQFTGSYFAVDLNTSYKITIEQGVLMLNHPRLKTVQLDPRTSDQFSGNQRHFSSIAFKRDAKNIIKGFYLKTSEINPIWFEKKL